MHRKGYGLLCCLAAGICLLVGLSFSSGAEKAGAEPVPPAQAATEAPPAGLPMEAPAEAPAEMPAQTPVETPTEAPWYQVTYWDAFGNLLYAQEAPAGWLVEPQEMYVPVPEGQVFLYWTTFYEDPLLADTPYLFGEPIGADVTLFPVCGYQPAPDAEAEAPVAYAEPPEADMPAEEVPAVYPEWVPGEADGLARGIAEGGPVRQVVVRIDAPKPARPGDRVALRAELTGYEDVSALVQWQVDAGGAWQDVPGATGLEHAFVLDEANSAWRWRAKVTVR